MKSSSKANLLLLPVLMSLLLLLLVLLLPAVPLLCSVVHKGTRTWLPAKPAANLPASLSRIRSPPNTRMACGGWSAAARAFATPLITRSVSEKAEAKAREAAVPINGHNQLDEAPSGDVTRGDTAMEARPGCNEGAIR